MRQDDEALSCCTHILAVAASYGEVVQADPYGMEVRVDPYEMEVQEDPYGMVVLNEEGRQVEVPCMTEVQGDPCMQGEAQVGPCEEVASSMVEDRGASCVEGTHQDVCVVEADPCDPLEE